MATFRDHDEVARLGALVDTRHITPSIRKGSSVYGVELKAYSHIRRLKPIEVVLSPDEAIRMGIELIQRAEMVRSEQQWDEAHPDTQEASA